ncbi:MAG: hypothetical protein V9G63_10710 [Candidatus Competibacter sp.]
MSLYVDLSSKLIEVLWREFVEPPLRKRLNARAQARLLESDPALSTLDKRIQQIERARGSLQDATEAVRELQEIAKSNKAEVEAVLANLAQVKTEKQAAEQELAALRKLAEVDVEAFRKVAGVPTQLQMAKERFRERAYGFFVASAIWWLLAKYVPALRS